ncbi:ATP-binding protein [Xanthomonas hyacinthi]|uniref:Kinase n=1 Tax=Xanthomonas hyacinthi TaxID=56455 RepID=A0A2S7EQQ0_9XANT|nr:AAA family ATPase [Xanthomonas hyacinthi]PPU95446.1 hypothetical protein XhyaCFBP1156_18800 [Xanthomonas hyacinthi]QGY78802.1 ATP-binding protein [Xanthomonas hyacinthi]
MLINPDLFLETSTGRVITPARNAWAWHQCFTLLSQALADAGSSSTLHVLVGAQGSGKSTWARSCIREDPNAVFFDAILVKRSERAPILAEAHRQGVQAVAVWFHTPLAICLQRNASRSPDEFANEQGLRNVFAAVEPTIEQEGFASILHVGRPA